MKKAMIVCAVLCAVSLLATFGFAAALGTQAVDGLFGTQGVVNQWWNRVQSEGIPQQIGQEIQEEIYDDDAPLQSSEALDFPAGETLRVTAYCGDIRLARGTGDRVEVSLLQYAYGKWSDSVYTVSVQNNSDITLSAPQQTRGVKAVLEIRVPETVRQINISVRTGDIDITGVSTGTLTAATEVGDIELEAVTADTATLTVTTGDVSTERSTSAGTLQIEVGQGEVDYDLPAAASVALTYTVTTGSVELEDEVQRRCAAETNRSGAGVSGSVQTQTGAGTAQSVSVHIDTGKLEISSDLD